MGRGYTVVPQYPASGYRIDLVVVGARGRLAVECDGDTWHGPEQYEHDLARERDLARCGWRFHRIRESAFYVDPTATMDALWSTLDDAGIHPSGQDTQRATDDDLTSETVPIALPRPSDTSPDATASTAELPFTGRDAGDPQSRALAVSTQPARANDSDARFRDGRMLLTVAARERVWQEQRQISQWLLHKHDPVAIDRLSNRAQREALQRKRFEYERRQQYLDRVLSESIADSRHAGGEWVTPGSILGLQFNGQAMVERFVVGLVSLEDGTPSVSPYSPLGEVLGSAELGAVLRYETPTGEGHVRVAEIVD